MKYILFVILILITSSSNAAGNGFDLEEIYGSSKDRFFTRTIHTVTTTKRNTAIENASKKAVREVERILDAPKNTIKYKYNNNTVYIYYIQGDDEKKIARFRIVNIGVYNEEYLVKLLGSLDSKYLTLFEDNNITDIDIINNLTNKIDIDISVPKKASKDSFKQITINTDFSNIKEIIRKSINSNKRTRLTGIIISNIITDDFYILKITDDSQIIYGLKKNNWIINIKPKKSGDLSFNLVLNLGVIINDIPTHLLIHSSNYKIKVTTSYYSSTVVFFQSNWKWLLATIIIPLIAFYGKIKYKTEKDEK